MRALHKRSTTRPRHQTHTTSTWGHIYSPTYASSHHSHARGPNACSAHATYGYAWTAIALGGACPGADKLWRAAPWHEPPKAHTDPSDKSTPETNHQPLLSSAAARRSKNTMQVQPAITAGRTAKSTTHRHNQNLLRAAPQNAQLNTNASLTTTHTTYPNPLIAIIPATHTEHPATPHQQHLAMPTIVVVIPCCSLLLQEPGRYHHHNRTKHNLGHPGQMPQTSHSHAPKGHTLMPQR